MTTLQIDDQTAEKLRRKAEQSGLTVEQYLQQLVQDEAVLMPFVPLELTPDEAFERLNGFIDEDWGNAAEHDEEILREIRERRANSR